VDTLIVLRKVGTMTRKTFFAAKVNIHGNIFSPNLEELINYHIPRVILESKPIQIHTWNWSFTDVKEIEHEGRKYIIGNVTKSKYAKQKVRIGKTTQRIQSEHELAHTAFFVYDPAGEILVHESTSAISDYDFRKLFTNLLSRDIYVGKVVIIPIPEPHRIREEILSFDKLTRLHFHLIHPNYGREEYNLYQQIIDENRLKELNIDMINKDGFIVSQISGENFNRSIENAISLVESGYGDIEVRGFNEVVVKGKRKKKIEKKKRSFSSKKAVRFIKTSEADENKLISIIINFIQDVKNKIKKDDEGYEEK
jgi:hypothetical protein